jgi:hypothetical protein
MELLFIFVLIGLAILFIDLLYFMANGKTWYLKRTALFIDMVFFIINPMLFFVLLDTGKQLDCCVDNLFFAPAHRLSIYATSGLFIVSYFLNKYGSHRLAPIPYFVSILGMLVGLAFNIAMAMQIGGLCMLGNLPILYLLLKQLYFDHQRIMQEVQEQKLHIAYDAFYFIKNIITHKVWVKYPTLLLLCVPFFAVLDGFLILFGQQPDSIIRAFTDTYYRGFSQLTAQCDNISCGGHYLCSVAAKGSKKMVKPKRLGIRNGALILCNRQLLVANAFEHMIEKRFPKLHKNIRKCYDCVGDSIHKNYTVYNHKIVSNTIYVLMKPLEWLFILTLYTLEIKPENNIEKQYTNFKN